MARSYSREEPDVHQIHILLLGSDSHHSTERKIEGGVSVQPQTFFFFEDHFSSFKLYIIPGTPGFPIIAPTSGYMQTQLGACNLFDGAGV